MTEEIDHLFWRQTRDIVGGCGGNDAEEMDHVSR